MSNINYPIKKTYVSGNLEGSGSILHPVTLKDDIGLTSVTVSSLTVNGTASINVLNTIEANSLKVGDKYITLMTGANAQADLDGAGVLFGSASLGESGEQGSVAHIIYKDALDKLEIYPGLKVSGSTQIVGSLSATGGITGSLLGTSSYSSNSDTVDGYHASQFAITGSNTFNGNQIITGSLTITANLTASNISGTLIGPAGGILSGSYPNPSGLMANSSGIIPVAPYNTSNSASLVANQNISNLYIKTSTSGNQGTHITLEASSGTVFTANNGGNVNILAGVGGTTNRGGNVTIKSYGQTYIGSETGQTSNGGSGGSHIVNIFAGNTTGYPDDTTKTISLNVSGSISGPSSNGFINIGESSNFGPLGGINIGKPTLIASRPRKIEISDTSVPVYYYGLDIHSASYVIPTSSSGITITNNTICLTPTASLTMSANPTLVASGYNSSSPDGARTTLINLSNYFICLLNDNSISPPTNYSDAYPSSSLKLGATQRVLKPWGSISLQYQKSGSSATAGGYWIETNFSNNLTGSTDLSQYALLSGSSITASSLFVNYIDFNTASYSNPPPPPAQLGRVFYNGATGDITTYLSAGGLYLNNGQQLIQKVKNINGSAITRGQVVHITGSDNSAAIPRVKLADWTNDGLSANTLGLVMDSSITDTAEGYIVVAGVLMDVNTSAYNSGDVLYLSSSGNLTNIKPLAPKHNVSVGQVVRSNGPNGSIYVKIQNGYELDELHDVSASLGKLNGDLLAWDSGNSVWKNTKQLSGSYNISGALSASSFVGDGSGITNIFASITSSGNLTGSGTFANAVTLKNQINLNAVTSSYLLNGQNVTASGDYSHAEGFESVASGTYSHAEGFDNIAIGYASHAEGYVTEASNSYSHAEGVATKAIGYASHAEGYWTIASASYQHVQGVYNQTSSTALMIVGNGTNTGSASRSNILEVYSNKLVLSGNLAFQDGKGIDFGASSGVSSSATSLNDYEEGTWTPIANVFTTGSSTGYYVKIGNYVNLTVRMLLFDSAGGGQRYITNIPYACSKQGTTVTVNETSTNDFYVGYVTTGSNRAYIGDTGTINNQTFTMQVSYYTW